MLGVGGGVGGGSCGFLEYGAGGSHSTADGGLSKALVEIVTEVTEVIYT